MFLVKLLIQYINTKQERVVIVGFVASEQEINYLLFYLYSKSLDFRLNRSPLFQVGSVLHINQVIFSRLHSKLLK